MRILVGILLAAVVGFAPRAASAGAIDLLEGDTVKSLPGVQILAVAAGEVTYQLFTDLDAGKNVAHRIPLEQVLRLKEHDAATFTHAEWHRTDLRNYRMAEDGYRQAIREAREGRTPKWSRTAAYARLVNLYLMQHRITDAIEAFVELVETGVDSAEKFLPAVAVTDDARAYDRGIRAIHAVLIEADKAGRPTAALKAFADRLEFRGAAPLREKGFFGFDELGKARMVFVAARNGPAEDPVVRSAIASAIRSLKEGQEFAVFFGSERSAAIERRVALNGSTVKSDHGPGRLTSVRADPRIVFDPLPQPTAAPAGDIAAGLEAALRMTGPREASASPEVVFLVVSGPPADWAALTRAAAANPGIDGKPRTRVSIVRIPADGATGPDEADGRWRATAAKFGGGYRRFDIDEWRRIWTCR